MKQILAWSIAGLLIPALIAGAQQLEDLGFTSRASDALAAVYSRKFNAPVPERFALWKAFAREQKALEFQWRLELAKGHASSALQAVNDAINGAIRYVEDADHWGASDY